MVFAGFRWNQLRRRQRVQKQKLPSLLQRSWWSRKITNRKFKPMEIRTPPGNGFPAAFFFCKLVRWLALEHKTRMAFFVPLFPDGDNLIDGDVANLILVVL